MDVNEFAGLIKAKHPVYKDVPADELTQRVLAKFPEYKSKVTLSSNALPPIGQDLQIPETPDAPNVLGTVTSTIGKQLRPLMPDAVVQSPIGQEIVKPRLQALGDVLSSKNPNLVQHPAGPATASPLNMLQDTVAGAEDLVGGVIGSISAGDLVMAAPSLIEAGISAILKRNLPGKNNALAKLAETDPMGAIKAGVPVKEWSKIDEWVNTLKANAPSITEAEWEPILQTRAKNMVDEVNGVLPTLQSRPGFIGPKPDDIPTPKKSIANPEREKMLDAQLGQVQQALPTAPAVPMKDWQADASIPGRTIYSNASGYKVEVPPGVEPSLFLKTIREVEKAQGEKSVIGEVLPEQSVTLPTNAKPAEQALEIKQTLPVSTQREGGLAYERVFPTQSNPPKEYVLKKGTSFYRGAPSADLNKGMYPNGTFLSHEKEHAGYYAQGKNKEPYQFNTNRPIKLLNVDNLETRKALAIFFKQNPNELDVAHLSEYPSTKSVFLPPYTGVQEAVFYPSEKLTTFIQNKGYDGYYSKGETRLISTEALDLQKTPAQEKAAFNKEMKKTPNVAPWAANKVLEVLNDPKTPSTMPKEGFLNVLKNKQVKPDQLEWDGLNDFLKGKEKITKKEVQKFVEENGLNLIEIDKNTPSVPKYVYSVVDVNGEPVQDGFYDSNVDAQEDINSKVFGNEKGLNVKRVTTGEVELGVDSTSYGHMKDLQLPGGTNYREKRFQLPATTKNVKTGFNDLPKRAQALVNKMLNDKIDFETEFVPELESLGYTTNAKYEGNPNFHAELDMSISKLTNEKGVDTRYTSGAYPEPGIVAETRYTDRTIGKDKVLFLEEVQSHMHQAGREQGYRVGTTVVPEMEVRLRNGQYRAVEKGQDKKDYSFYGEGKTPEEALANGKAHFIKSTEAAKIPNAPFKAGKHVELVMKRMVRQAIEEGKDGIAWTTGQMQKDRYKLSNWVSQIDYKPNAKKPGTFDYITFKKNGDEWTSHEAQTPEQIDKTIGKGYAKQMQESVGKPITKENHISPSMREGYRMLPENLKIGGVWADNLYDQQMVNFANKFFGKWGAKVKQDTLPAAPAIRIDKNARAALRDTATRIVDGDLDYDEAKQTLMDWMDPDGEIMPEEVLSEELFDTWTSSKDPYRRKQAISTLSEQLIANATRKGASAGRKVSYLKFTPELMRVALKQGFSLFVGIGAAGLGTSGVSEEKHK